MAAKGSLTPTASCCVVLTGFPEERGYSPRFSPQQPRHEAVKTQATQRSMALFPGTRLPSCSEMTLMDTSRPMGHCPQKQ